ncbi:MAG TPA: aminopeptidase [Chloroflexota bacterium]|jgi:aminopeptidase|nr:aminopeptidase [Chloroflexota bacterium]
MRDPRVDQLAEILVRYSTELKRGDKLLIHGPELAQPLALAVYREALLVGALPVLWSTFDEAARVLFDVGDEAQLAWENPILIGAARSVDAYVSLRAPTNLRMLSTVEPAKTILAQKARRPFLDVVLQKRWVLCEFPTPALAQEAGMSLREFEEFSFGAVLIDWPAMRTELARRKRQLQAGHEIRIVGRGTDLRMGIGGRVWVADDGKHNMPGGEIFTGPIEDSVEGEIAYEYPAVHNGREVEGVRMRFASGRVVDASATRGEEFLLSMLDVDEGARRLGELGIGTNYGISRHTKSVLFDEKIGGTVHLAVGRSYEETGGTNASAVHWDMVKDLREGGELHLDGKVVQRGGRWLD